MMNKFLLAICFFCCACGTKPSDQPCQKKPLVLVSLAPYHYLTEKIAGDTLEVRVVVPQNANPHGYEPTIQQMKEIQGAALWFRIGEFFEEKLLPALKHHNPQMEDIDLRDGVSLLRNHCCAHHSASEDRHIWMSPKWTAVQAEKIRDALSQRFPEHRDIFMQNARDCLQELEALDGEIKEILASSSDKTFLVPHSAFAYFCEEYHVTQISIEFQGKEPTSSHLKEIMQEMESKGTKIAIAMPQHSNKGLDYISKALGLEVHTVNPYGENPIETMRLLAETIAGSQ